MRKFLFLILIVSVCSCRNYKLSKQDLEWNPYSEGQMLIFKNEKGDTKTYYISKVNKQFSRTNVYAGNLSARTEQLTVHLSTEKNPKNPMEQTILAISRSTSKNESMINFFIDFIDYKFSTDGLLVQDLESYKTESLTVGGNAYKDVLSFPQSTKDEFNSPISKIYWSKREGILRMIFKHGGAYDLAR